MAGPIQNVEFETPSLVTPGPQAAPTPQPEPQSLAEMKDKYVVPENVKINDNAGAQQPLTTPEPSSNLKGDDLINSVNKDYDDKTNEASALLNVLSDSKEWIKAKSAQDPQYAKSILPQIQSLKGSAKRDFIINEADSMKIEQMKKTNPAIFNSFNAAISGAVNSLTLGQDSRLGGLLDTAFSGGDLNSNIAKRAETLRLLDKAFPNSNFLGKVAGFMVPESIGAKITTAAAKLSTSGIKSGFDYFLKNAAKDPSLVQRLITTVGSGAAAGATYGVVQGTIGEGTQDVSPSRGIDSAETGALWGGGISLGEQALVGASRGIAKAASNSKSFVAKMVGELSGANPEALRAYNAQSPNKEFSKMAGSQRAIGDELVNYVYDYNEDKLPELQTAKKLLPGLPNIDPSEFFNYIRSIKPSSDPESAVAVSKMKQWVDGPNGFVKKLGPDGKVTASQMSQWKSDLQEAAKGQYGKDSPEYASLVKDAGAKARLEIIKSAAKSSQVRNLTNLSKPGVQYIQLMNQAADKMNVISEIKSFLGTNKEVAEKKAVTFLNSMFGKNADLIQRRMQALDQQFGTNFVEKAKQADLATSLDPTTGTPKFFPQHTTGRSGLGFHIAGAVGAAAEGANMLLGGGIPGAVVAAGVTAPIAAASSPRMGALLIGTSDKISGAINKMFQQPQVFDQIANAKQVPPIVRSIANKIGVTLKENGPLSAAGMVRMVADTPLFLGLVHAYDVASRAQQEKVNKSLGRKNNSQQNPTMNQ